MMRSLSSGVSGLKAHQMAMDVIGNNIANVNTVGFKSGRVTFQEVFSETLKGAGSPQNGRGGTNPEQVGLGTSVSSIDTIMTRGAVNRTDAATDLCISGEGFFIVSDDSKFLNRSYTRAGNFTLDKTGNLVTSSGMKVLGYMYDSTTNKPKASLEGISIPLSTVSDPQATSNSYDFESADGTTLSNTIKAGAVMEGNLDASKGTGPDSTKETTFKVFDSLGNIHDIKATMTRLATNDTGASQTWNVTFTDPTVTPPALGAFGSTGFTGFHINFDANGKPIYNTSTTAAGSQDSLCAQINLTGISPASPLSFNVSFAKLTAVNAESTASVTSVSGYPQGTLDSYSITSSGEIKGVFSNGQSRTLARVGMALFKNPAGLEKTGENMYQVSNNSGDPIYGTPGDGGMGQINPGALEMSNVDLSKEFTSMITIERGFQANSKTITTSDEMLQELVNLKR
jgi:flagellar hook protein FlgE